MYGPDGPSLARLRRGDFGLSPGKPRARADAVIDEALEVLKQPGSTLFSALAQAATKLGVRVPTDADSGTPLRLLVALGPAAIPLTPPAFLPNCLTRWKVSPGELAPFFDDLARRSPMRHAEALEWLARNVHLSPADRVAVRDAVVCSTLSGAPQPISSTPVSLDTLVKHTIEVGQGFAFANSVATIGELLHGGLSADRANLTRLADRVATSGEFSVRMYGAALFWKSSDPTELSLRAFLESLELGSSEWSKNAYLASIDQLSQRDAWAFPARATPIQVEACASAVGQLLVTAPPDAPIAALVVRAANYEITNLAADALTAIERSTRPVGERLRMLDLLVDRMRFFRDRRADNALPLRRAEVLLGQLLREHPTEVKNCPFLVEAQLGVAYGTKEAEKAVLRRPLAEAPDYLAAVRELEQRTLALPPPDRDHVLNRKWQLEALAFNAPNGASALETLKTGEKYQAEEAVWEARLAGVSADVLLGALVDRGLPCAPAVAEAAKLLADPACSNTCFEAHFATVFRATVSLVRRGETIILPESTADAERAQRQLIVALNERGFSKETQLKLLEAALPPEQWVEGRALLDGGLDAELVEALAARPNEAGFSSFDFSLTPSSRLQFDAVRAALSTRADEFRAAVSTVAPSKEKFDDSPTAEQAASEAQLKHLFSKEVLTETPAEVEAALPDRESRFILDVRRGLTFAQLEERYRDLPLGWGAGDSAPKGQQLAAMLRATHLGMEGVAVLAAVASPNLSEAEKKRFVSMALTVTKAGTTGNSSPPALRALRQGWPGSLEWVVPALLDAAQNRCLDGQTVNELRQLLEDPRLSKESALKLTWALAESVNFKLKTHDSDTTSYHLSGTAGAAALCVLSVAERRADLTDEERRTLRQADAFLRKLPSAWL